MILGLVPHGRNYNMEFFKGIVNIGIIYGAAFLVYGLYELF